MENENILTFFSVVFLTGFFLILPVYAVSSFELATPDEFGPNELLSGVLIIPQGVYSQNEKVKLTITDAKEKTLKELLAAADYEESYSYYSASGSLLPDASGTDFTVGILFPKDSLIPEDAQFSFKISPLANPVQEPKIDLGNDGIDWTSNGVPGITYLEAKGITSTENTEEQRITTNCERLFTQKTMEIKLKSYVKTTQNTIPYVSVFDKDLNEIYYSKCKGTVSSADFAWLECNITLEESGQRGIFDIGYYSFCLSSGVSNKIKTTAENELKEGYSECSSGGECTKLGYDYLINIQPLAHDSFLKSEETITMSNQDGSLLITKLAAYLQNCVYTIYNNKEYCVIPIHIKTGDANELKISDLVLEEQVQGTVRTISRFAANLKEESGTLMLFSDTPIDLQKFSMNVPAELKSYKLKAEFKSYSDEKNISVIPKPIANISISSALLAPGEQAIFSAEGSSSPDDSLLSYNWAFSDNTSFTTKEVTKSFAKSGKYTVTLIVKDAKGRISVPRKEELTVSTLISRTPLNFQETKYSFDNAYTYYQTAPAEIKEVYTDLGLGALIENSKATLDDYETKLNISQLSNIDEQLASISEKIPRLISVQDSLTIKPYLTYSDISSVYPAEQEESKLAIQNINEKIEKEIKAKIVKITYINAAQESFVLVKETFTTKAPLEKVFVKQVLPSTLSVSQLTPVKETPEVVNQQTLNYRFDSFTNELSIIYLLNTDNLLSISKIITILTPENLNIKLIAFDCPNSICNPAEDYLSCPEDCTCGNNKCETAKGETPANCPADCSRFPWTAFVITIIIILVAGAIKLVSVFKPGYITSIKPVQKLMAMLSIKQKIPFSSNVELNKLVAYIKSAKSKNIPEKNIKNVLAKNGWSEKQINFAFMRAK